MLLSRAWRDTQSLRDAPESFDRTLDNVSAKHGALFSAPPNKKDGHESPLLSESPNLCGVSQHPLAPPAQPGDPDLPPFSSLPA